MTVRYTNSFRDLMGLCFHHHVRSPVMVATYGSLFLFLSYIIFQGMPADRPLLARLIAFVILEILVLCLMTGIFSVIVVLTMISKRNKTFLTEHVFTLGDEAIFNETMYSKTEFKWAGVQKLARTRKYVFIYVAQHSAHIVPRRAFRDESEWESFYEFCRRKTVRS